MYGVSFKPVIADAVHHLACQASCVQYAGRMLTGISGAGVLDEKASAVSALGAYAGDMGAAFGPYIEATLKVLLDLAGVSLHSRLRPSRVQRLAIRPET